MKRVLLVLLFLVVFGAAGLWWWMSRESGSRILQDAQKSALELRTAEVVRFDLGKTDPATNATTGFTFLGRFNASDVTHPELLGSLRIGAKTSTDRDQTLDVALSKSRVAVRPRDVLPQYQELAQNLSQDPSGVTFLVADRDSFLLTYGFPGAPAKGTSEAIRGAFAFVLPTIIPSGEVIEANEDGRATVSTSFRFDRRASRPFLISLVSAWTGRAPNVDEYAWIDRTVEGAAQGSFRVTLDQKTRQLIRLTGSFPLVDDDARELSRITIDMAFGGINRPISIAIPEPNRDVTSDIVSKPASSAFPVANVLPNAATGTGAVSPPKFDPSQIDLFQQYSEEMKRKKDLY